MADSVEATDSARQLAEEKGIDLSSVSGSGSGGKVTKSDVEQASGTESMEAESAAEEAPEKFFYLKVNPALGRYQSKVVVGDREFLAGDELPSNVVSQSEYEELRSYKDPEHGTQLLLKGKEVS